jgi:tetratricopeptide (TPR) repeat protein
MAFFQDDYATAEQYWKQSYDHIDDADSRAWILYRIGLCRQRLDRFAEADATFSDVESNFPNTEPAQRAREHACMRGFYVQVGPFTDPLAAKKAGDGLRAMGIASKPQMAGSAQVVMAGPRNTYREAQQLRERLITSYPTAVIVP